MAVLYVYQRLIVLGVQEEHGMRLRQKEELLSSDIKSQLIFD
jgi:hypothetical protein